MNAASLAVPFLDLTAEFAALEADWITKIRTAGSRASFILGPEVAAFEREFANHIGVKHAIAVANGTDALVLSLRALDIGPGHEVITTPYSFFASSEAISLVGATPVFADVLEDGFTLDPEQVAQRLTPRTRAILPVHIFGRACEMQALEQLARSRGVAIVEDCAQAFGARTGGRCVGAIGDCGAFSFYPTKVLGCYGDGGMITTGSDAIAERLRQLRNHGSRKPYLHSELGYNSRLDEIQAALLRLKLARVNVAIEERRRVAREYDRQLAASAVRTPAPPEDGAGHVYNVYTVRVPRRDAVREALSAAAIASALYYPLGLHLQEAYTGLGYRPGSMPVCERITAENLSLPIYPGMPIAHIERVCTALRAAVD